MPIQAYNIVAEPYTTNMVKLTWNNPDDINFKEVAVIRRNDQPSLNISEEGNLEIYRGTSEVIFDYLKSGSASTDFKNIPDYDGLDANTKALWLDGEKNYYYTLFTIDKSNNARASYASTKVARPIERYDLGGWLYNQIPTIYQNEDEKYDLLLQRYYKLLGYSLDYLYSLINVDTRKRLDPNELNDEDLQKLSKMLGWELDRSLPLQNQRRIVKNITNLYKYTGTKLGIIALIKYYASVPVDVIIEEKYLTILKTPYFGLTEEEEPLYTDNITPNFSTLNEALIGTPDDPLFYIWDFSLRGISSSDTVIIDVTTKATLTLDAKTLLQTQLEKALGEYLPINCNFTLNIN
jgi:phage tail-like protein